MLYPIEMLANGSLTLKRKSKEDNTVVCLRGSLAKPSQQLPTGQRGILHFDLHNALT